MDRLVGVLESKAPDNRRRDRLYDAKERVQLLGASVPDRYAQTASVIGWPAKAVDALASRCVLSSMDQVNAGDDLDVARLVRDNEIRSEISGAVTSMLLHGPAFLVSSAGGSGEPRGLLHVVSAHDGTGDWNPRSRRLDSFLSVHDRDEVGAPKSFTLYLPDVTVTAVRERSWTLSRSAGTGEVPVEVLRYRSRPDRKQFGRSRITRPVIGLTRAAMRVAIRLEAHSDAYSRPTLAVLGASAEDFETKDDEAVLRLAVGTLFGLPDDENAANPRATLQQIASSSPQPHLDQLRQYAQLFSGETSIPVSSLGVSDMSNPTSADSYIASREDLIGEAEAVMDGVSASVERAVSRSLAYQHGLSLIPDEWDLRSRWRPAAHGSKAAAADAGAKTIGSLPWLADTELGVELLGLTESQQERAKVLLERGRSSSLIDQLLSATPATPEPVEEQ